MCVLLPAVNVLSLNLPETKPIVALTALAGLLLWETLAPFFQFSAGLRRLKHGLKNILLGVINGLVTSFFFVGLWWYTADWATQHDFGLLHMLPLPPAVECVFALLMLDVWTYLWHRMNHRIPFFWRFHRVHHSDAQMDVTTAHRFHVGEIIFSSFLRIPLIALLGIRLEALALYEVLMFVVVQFHHANITVSNKWDRVLRLVIVTPLMHKVHHSRWQPETDSNFSSLLSVWDRLFRSFRLNPRPESLLLGLDGFDEVNLQSFTGMIKTPLGKNITRQPPPFQP